MPYGKRGIAVRIFYLLAAGLFFFFKLLKKNPLSGTIVLCYHGITGSERDRFVRQMRMIKRRAIAIKELDNLQEPRSQVSKICVTFDDAFANLIPNVIPTTSEFEIPITIFIATNSLGSFPIWLNGTEHRDSCEMVMTESQLLALKGNRFIEFGSHTTNHPRLSQLQGDGIRGELCSSRNTLKEIFKDQIEYLALPHGDFNKEVLQIASEEGYKKIFTLEPIPYTFKANSIYPTVGRFSMSPMAWPVEFYLTINGAYAWLAPWRSFLRKIRNS